MPAQCPARFPNQSDLRVMYVNDQPKAPQRVSTRPAGTSSSAKSQTGGSQPVRRSTKPAPKPGNGVGRHRVHSGQWRFRGLRHQAANARWKRQGEGGKGKKPQQPRWKRVAKITGLTVLITGCAVVVLGFFGPGHPLLDAERP